MGGKGERSGRRRKEKKLKKTEKQGGLDRHVTSTDSATHIDLPGLTAKSFPVLFELSGPKWKKADCVSR